MRLLEYALGGLFVGAFVSRGCGERALDADQAADHFVMAFGSCNDANKSQPLWPLIESRKPQAWLWGGDNVYADWRPKTMREFLQVYVFDDPSRLQQGIKGLFFPAYPAKWELLYNRQRAQKGYASLVESVGRHNIIGIWDDHDVGANDGGKSLGKEFLALSQKFFLDFLEAPEDDERHSRPGIYTHRDFVGGAVRFILLDTRQFRDDYELGEKGDILGTAQSAWLERILLESKAKFNLIVSGVQVLPNHPVNTGKAENWERLPAARRRLLKLVSESRAQGVMFLSGDVHFAELSAASCQCKNDDGSHVSFTLGEVTSSGMTHAWDTYPATVPYIFKAMLNILRFEYRLGNNVYTGLNWGELEFHGLQSRQQSLSTRILDLSGQIALEHTWTAADLKPRGELKECSCGPNQELVSTSELAVRISVLVICVAGAHAIAALLLFKLVSRIFFSSSRRRKEKKT